MSPLNTPLENPNNALEMFGIPDVTSFTKEEIDTIQKAILQIIMDGPSEKMPKS